MAFGQTPPGYYGGLAGLGDIYDGVGSQLLAEAVNREHARQQALFAQRSNYLAGYTPTKAKTIREELQYDVDEWLKDIDI